MAHPALISDHVGTNAIIISERHAHHSHLTMWEPIPQLCRKGPTLTSDHERNQSSIHVRKALHLHLTMRGTNPTYMSKRICTYIQPCEEPIQHTCLKGLCTYIYPCEEPIQHACQKGSALTSAHARNQSSMHVIRALQSHLIM